MTALTPFTGSTLSSVRMAGGGVGGGVGVGGDETLGAAETRTEDTLVAQLPEL